jgi:hypothetical protein
MTRDRHQRLPGVRPLDLLYNFSLPAYNAIAKESTPIEVDDDFSTSDAFPVELVGVSPYRINGKTHANNDLILCA